MQGGGGGGGGAVNKVSNSDGSLTISPTTGNVVASLNTANANTFTANQTINGVLYSNSGISSPNTFSITANGSVVDFGYAGQGIYTGDTIFSLGITIGNTGYVQMFGYPATSTYTLRNSGAQQLIGAYWNGTTSINYGMQIYWIQDSTSPSGHLSFNSYNNGTITEVAKITSYGYIVFGGTLSLLNGYSISISDNGTFNTYGSFFQVSSSGIRYNNMAQTTLSGTTAGSIVWAQIEQGSAYKKFVGYANGYENTTATAQSITFPTPFINPPIILGNDTGMSLITTATTLTLPASMGSAATGNIIIEGA